MIDPRIEQALRSSEPITELRNVALHLFADGQTSEAVLDLFERARQQLRQSDRETDEDASMDVMDEEALRRHNCFQEFNELDQRWRAVAFREATGSNRVAEPDR